MTKVKEKASRLKRLNDDPIFKEVIEAVKMLQVSIFTDPNSTTEDRDNAHDIIRALSTIDNYINTALADEKIFDKKN
ncbi:hypothetical protein [Planktomarina sp.]|uniref:hypothetical protein n=1 Tax=Planktomarina sp. TaxID=2024851 RepID=UPI0032604D36